MIASPAQPRPQAPAGCPQARGEPRSALRGAARRATAGARPRLAGAALLLAAVALAGCASQRTDRSGLFEPYRIDLPQGNYVTQEMLDQVKPGMTRSQVRAALGSPLLETMFRDNRWDYVFRYKHASGRSEQRRVTVHFSDERVASVEADTLPPREDPSDPALPGSTAPR